MSDQVQSPRHQYFVDCEVQAAVLTRVSIYGIAMTLYFAITLICTQWMNEPDRGFVDSLSKCFEDVAYWLPGFLLLAPIAAHDLIKMTNQFAGPITRLRREMKLLIEDKSDRPLSFREDDYWVEMTSAYNQIRGELLQLRKRLGEVKAEDEAVVDDLPASLIIGEDDDTVKLAMPPTLSLDLPVAESVAV